MWKNIKVLDLFSWCWGLTEWFFGKNYSFVGHVEMDHHACESLKTRIIYHHLKDNNWLDDYYKYLKSEITREEIIEKYKLQSEIDMVYNSEISDETNPDLIKNIKKNLNWKKLDILIGWPPCQTYSNVWRSRLGEKIEGDSRNFLFLQYAKFLKELQPEIFVFENVPGLKTAGWWKYLEAMKTAFDEAWYHLETSDKVVQYMPDYWIVQNRKRLIIIWWKKDSKKIDSYPNLAKYKKDFSYIVNDFLDDLPPIQVWGWETIMKYKKDNPLLVELWIRDKNENILENHTTRPIREHDRKIYKIAVEKYEQDESLVYSDLPSELITHKNTSNFQNRFNVIKGQHKVTNTVVAHLSKDGHYYIHPDKKQNRSISIREAARIQTFPDNFKFEWWRTAAFRQIWNAVPPMFSKIIATELKKYFL